MQDEILHKLKEMSADLHLLFTNDTLPTMDVTLYNEILLALDGAQNHIIRAQKDHQSRKKALAERYMSEQPKSDSVELTDEQRRVLNEVEVLKGLNSKFLTRPTPTLPEQFNEAFGIAPPSFSEAEFNLMGSMSDKELILYVEHHPNLTRFEVFLIERLSRYG